MAIELIADHVAEALARFISQYQNKPRIAAWSASYNNEVQAVEQAIYDVIMQRLIDVAVGVQLDAIGRIVGEAREGRVDAVYSLYLSARIRANRSEGHTGDLIAVIAIVETMTYSIDDTVAKANIVIEFNGIPTQDPNELLSILRDTKAGGVGLRLIVATDDTDMFLFDNVGDVDNANNSFSDCNVVDGTGLLSSVYL